MWCIFFLNIIHHHEKRTIFLHTFFKHKSYSSLLHVLIFVSHSQHPFTPSLLICRCHTCGMLSCDIIKCIELRLTVFLVIRDTHSTWNLLGVIRHTHIFLYIILLMLCRRWISFFFYLGKSKGGGRRRIIFQKFIT